MPSIDHWSGQHGDVLQVKDLVKRYDGRFVIDHLSFQARKGEFLALLGPSGAGKTTLLRCMAGFLAPDSGEVIFEGVRATELTRQHRRRIALVFQQFDLVGRLDALDNVLAGRLGHVSEWRGLLRQFPREDRLFALECLDRVGLLEQASQRADTLSGGQQQRVAIARALAQRPDLILADEPIASLDPQSGDAVLELLGELSRQEGLAVVCSLHQLEFARRWADRIIGMRAGRLITDVEAASFDDAMARRVYGETGLPLEQSRDS